MPIKPRQILGVALAGVCVWLVVEGVRRARRGGDALAMVMALAEIAVPASFLLGYGLALCGIQGPAHPPGGAQVGDR